MDGYLTSIFNDLYYGFRSTQLRHWFCFYYIMVIYQDPNLYVAWKWSNKWWRVVEDGGWMRKYVDVFRFGFDQAAQYVKEGKSSAINFSEKTSFERRKECGHLNQHTVIFCLAGTLSGEALIHLHRMQTFKMLCL